LGDFGGGWCVGRFGLGGGGVGIQVLGASIFVNLMLPPRATKGPPKGGVGGFFLVPGEMEAITWRGFELQ
jgi:hypothetical protein